MCIEELQRIYKFREKCLATETLRKQSVKVELPPSVDYNSFQNTLIPIENEAFNDYLVQENVEIEQVHPAYVLEKETVDSQGTCNEANTKKKKKFICICRKIFTNQNALKSHYSIHLDKKPYQCDVCANCYASIYTLNTHKKRVHGIGITKVVAEQMNKCVEVEIKDKSEKEPYKCPIKLLHQCDECPKSFTRKSRLNAHKRKIHLSNNIQDSSTGTQYSTLPWVAQMRAVVNKS